MNAKEPGLEPPPHAQTTEASVVVEVHGAEGGKPVAQTPNKPPPRPIDGPTAPLIDLKPRTAGGGGPCSGRKIVTPNPPYIPKPAEPEMLTDISQYASDS